MSLRSLDRCMCDIWLVLVSLYVIQSEGVQTLGNEGGRSRKHLGLNRRLGCTQLPASPTTALCFIRLPWPPHRLSKLARLGSPQTMFTLTGRLLASPMKLYRVRKPLS
jgi:hypothetical protein